MARKTVCDFTVTGTFPFPLDMLRYDTCYPADHESVVAIEESIQRVNYRTYTVKLRSRVSAPTQERWHSFQWTVDTNIRWG